MYVSNETRRIVMSLIISSAGLWSAEGSLSRVRASRRSVLSRLVVPPVAAGEAEREPVGVKGFPGFDVLAAPLPYEREAGVAASARPNVPLGFAMSNTTRVPRDVTRFAMPTVRETNVNQ